MDVTALILAQHHRQRRLFAALDDVTRTDVDALTAIWNQLAALLETHADAEEKFFYPRLLDIGKGGGRTGNPDSETKDAIKDHNEIRDAIAEAAQHTVGSEKWWQAVATARAANSDHMAEEERQDLADFRRHADLQIRHHVGVQFLAYQRSHPHENAHHDKDPQRYVESHGYVES